VIFPLSGPVGCPSLLRRAGWGSWRVAIAVADRTTARRASREVGVLGETGGHLLLACGGLRAVACPTSARASATARAMARRANWLGCSQPRRASATTAAAKSRCRLMVSRWVRLSRIWALILQLSISAKHRGSLAPYAQRGQMSAATPAWNRGAATCHPQPSQGRR
jgi:hypothetical protein